MSAMINWDSVLINACWIVGLAILLARFSYSRWQKAIGDDTTHPSESVVKIIAYILIGIGLIGTASTWWERLIWVFLIGALIFLTYKSVAPPTASSEQ
jgi:hypothetical protein